MLVGLARSSSTVRLKIIGNEMIKNVGQSESCMVSKLPIIFKRTRTRSVSTGVSIRRTEHTRTHTNARVCMDGFICWDVGGRWVPMAGAAGGAHCAARVLV